MAAIKYGSYYWYVVLNPKEPNARTETIYLHADQVSVDQAGSVIFVSKGRRPAGVEPGEDGQPKNQKSGSEEKKEHKAATPQAGMIYFALALGSWKLVYAAKLQDGSPASVEHWNAGAGRPVEISENAGAAGFVPAT